jgi:hypothetical protein
MYFKAGPQAGLRGCFRPGRVWLDIGERIEGKEISDMNLSQG